MAVTAKMVASEILMCGLRQVPVVGTAVEVIAGIQSRHEMLQRDEKLAEIERTLTSFERRMRDLARQEIEAIVGGLRTPGIDGAALTHHIRNFRAIREHGLQPSLFEGLLRNSPHWEELQGTPDHYGEVLADGKAVDPQKIQVVIDATDKARVLELTPFAFASLLSQQRGGAAKPKMVCSADVWAFAGAATVKGKRRRRPTATKTPPVAAAPGAVASVAVTFAGAWMIFDSNFDVYLDDEFLGRASIKKGFQFHTTAEPGPHLLRQEASFGPFKRTHSQEVIFPEPGDYKVRVEWGRLVGRFYAVVEPARAARRRASATRRASP